MHIYMKYYFNHILAFGFSLIKITSDADNRVGRFWGWGGWMGRSHAEPIGFSPPPPIWGTRIMGLGSRLRDE